MPRRLQIAFVLDSVRSPDDRVIAALRGRHEVTTIGIGGDVALAPLLLPLVSDRVCDARLARPDTDRIDQALASAEVVHIQHPTLLGFEALRLARQRRVPTVAGHHVPLQRLLERTGLLPRPVRWLLDQPRGTALTNALLSRAFFQRASAVVCPSPLSRRELLLTGLDVPTVIVATGAPAQFAPAPHEPNGPFTLLSVGALTPVHRHDVVIDAVARARHSGNLRLIVAGEGPLREQLRLQARAGRAHVEVGYLAADALLARYQSADLFVHACESELESPQVLEAMRCGCPALVANAAASAARQFAIDPAHLFPAGDAAALARLIDAHVEHSERTTAERALTLEAVSHLGLEQTVANHESLYLALTDRRLDARRRLERAVA